MKNIYIFAALLSTIILTPSSVLGQRVISSIGIESLYQNDDASSGVLTVGYDPDGRISSAAFTSKTNTVIEHKITVNDNVLTYDMNTYMQDMLVMIMPMAGTLQDGRITQLSTATESAYPVGIAMSFTYGDSEHVTKAIVDYAMYNEVLETEMTWSNGNIVQENITATSWENGGVVHFNYTSLPSNPLLGALFGFSDGPDPSNVFPVYTYMGKQSENLISSIVCDWNDGDHVELTYDWETDTNGEVSAVNIAKNGRNIYKYTFTWSGSSDAILTPTSNPAVNTPWYDLSGRTVKNPGKGINIRQGQKVLFLQ